MLPLCLGRATRLARFLTAGEKTYRASVRLGFATTTDDLTGEPLGEPRPVDVTEEALRSALRALVTLPLTILVIVFARFFRQGLWGLLLAAVGFWRARPVATSSAAK